MADKNEVFKLMVRTFTGATIEEACAKADNYPIPERMASVQSSHIVAHEGGFTFVIVGDCRVWE